MKRLDTLKVEHIYNLYRCFAGQDKENNNGVGSSNKNILPMWYYCADCGTSFLIKHRERPVSMFWYGFGENYVICPSCRVSSVDNRFRGQICTYVNNEDFEGCWSNSTHSYKQAAPFNVKLELYETQNSVKLRATFKTIRLHLNEVKSDLVTDMDKRIETIDFNLKKRKTTLKIDHEAPIEIGMPKTWDNLRKTSLLRCLSADVIPEKPERPRINSNICCQEKIASMAKTLREACQRKWLEIHGFSLKRIYTRAQYTNHGGFLLRQIHNIAFRMVCPDIPNLVADNDDLRNTFGTMPILNDFDTLRKSKNTVQSIIESMGLPNKPAVRRLVSKKPFNAIELSLALKATNNYDCNMAIYEILNNRKYKEYRREVSLDEDQRNMIYNFLTKVSAVYTPRQIRQYIEHTTEIQEMQDLIRLSRGVSLNVFTKSLSKMHDILVEERNRMAAEEERRREAERKADAKFRKKLNALRSCDAFALNIPDSVKQRLIMQLNAGRGRFFLPETNKDLNYTSDIMHNCVRTYDEAILKQNCNVVYYTNENGKLLACIEVKNNRITQAKLSHNRKVKEDAEINQIILEWAKAKKLEIHTYDIDETVAKVEESIEVVA